MGQLPAVAERGLHRKRRGPDAAETAAWQKRGGYLGITLEAMDKDDVGRLRSAPRLASAAWLTLGRSISAIFTDNAGVGPTLADGKALFHVDHANLEAVALSSASWAAAKLAMRKQTGLNESGERLGELTAPKFLLVPPDLENTALTLLGSEGLPGTANNSERGCRGRQP